MKKTKLIGIILFVGLLFNSCDLMEVTPRSTLTSQVVWQNEGDAEAGINGMLNSFRSTFNGVNFLFWFELRSGNWQFGRTAGGAATPGWEHMFNNTLNASASPGTNWANFYTTINSANLAIKYIPIIDFNNETTKNRLLAQAYFVRAYTYYALVRIYGDVPIVLEGFESVQAEDLFPERKPIEEVFIRIKEDLEIALTLLSEDVQFSRIKPTNAALNMLKADVYLWTAKRLNGGSNDLSIAKNAVDVVLLNPNYQLLDNYETVFRDEGNQETIFSLYFAINESTNHYSNITVINLNDLPSQYHNNPVIVGNSPNRLTFSDFYIEEYLNKGSNDIRKDVNLGEFNVDGQVFRWINKFIGEWSDGQRYFTSNTMIYRYAETILFKAEILNAQGQTTEAISYLNQIAERAYGIDDFYSTTLSKNEVDDAILDERLIEFGAEGKAWFDIIRFGQAFERIPSLIGRENENEGNILLFPISPETITRNPNITQTPGY